MSQNVILMSRNELNDMRFACQQAALLLDYLGSLVRPGISTEDLDQACVAWTKVRGYKNGPLGYGRPPFPKSICTSVNDVVCHGIPSPNKILKNGDIINIDVTPVVKGYFGDTSKTFLVGNVSAKAKKLVEVTADCLRLGISEVAPGKRLGDIGAAIQGYAEAHGFSVVRDFVGHGVGKIFHMEPQVAHYGQRGTGMRLQEGMVFTIEPMINEGGYGADILRDKWTAVTKDRKLSAQFEHTVAVTADGVEVLTLKPDEKYPLVPRAG